MNIKLTIPVTPIAASRPRVTKTGRTYYQATYQNYKIFLKNYFEQNITERNISENLSLKAEFVLPRPKKSKFDSPMGDIDNYLKSFDALEAAGIIVNDRRRLS